LLAPQTPDGGTARLLDADPAAGTAVVRRADGTVDEIAWREAGR
jgi:hypothetical protein